MSRVLMLVACLLSVLFNSIEGRAQVPGKWGDLKDGTYANPILPGDFQNTDVIRVGDTYYYISATKELSPGMLIMSSRDLVNWKMMGHAVKDITQISPKYNYDKMEGVGRGLWAGSIRFHNKKFYVYFTDPDYGLFMTSAADPAGPWKPLTLIKGEPGWDDPCPLWDDNGKAYLVMTHFADNYKIYLFEMSSDGKKLLDTGKVIHQSRGSEANKLYKINGYYYHFYSELTPEGRMPFITRSSNIYGPYKQRRQLIHKAKAEPNQGGMVETKNGEWYFVTHHGEGYWSGREASLLPITWVDGWPLWGTAGADSIGNMMWTDKKPINSSVTTTLNTNDEFNSNVLSPQWEWYFQPRSDSWSLTERKGFLRMYARKPLQPNVVNKTVNVLTQRPLRTDKNIATVRLDVSHMKEGQVVGLSLFGKTAGTVSVKKTQNDQRFFCNLAGIITEGDKIKASTAYVWLRATWDIEGKATFYYSTNGNEFNRLGGVYQIVSFSNSLGAKIGIHTSANEEEKGFVDVDWFHYDAN